MKIAVVVACYNAPALLRQCLQALTSQPAVGPIVVSDCSDSDPAAELQADFPDVQFVHFPARRTLPELRWAVFERLDAEIVAAIEARAIPSADWADRLVRAYPSSPRAAATGGPVELAADASPLHLALYLCEFASAAATEGRVSLANISYRRDVLERYKDFFQTGAWETVLNQRLLGDGFEIAYCDAAVTYRHDGLTLGDVLAQRLHYGRAYAAERVKHGSGRRWYALVCPWLPLLLIWRTFRDAQRAGLTRVLLRALPAVFVLHCVWALGEFIGYACGPSNRASIY
jgi:glycosyltransferase involved in cell wall biosynthesis